VRFSERVPSNDWAALEHLGEQVAEAWFKPDGEPFRLVFRVPRNRFELVDISQQLTVEDLLTAAAIANEQVESWRFGDEFHLAMDGSNPELKRILPPPPPDESHLTVQVRLKPSDPTAAADETDVQAVPLDKWQALEALWRSILGLETSIDTLRLSMESLRIEMEAAFKKSLTVEDKIHALQADVLQWTKAKSRIHYALPKLREYIHRATWAQGLPERKRLEEIVENYIGPRIPLPEMDEVRAQMGHLQKGVIRAGQLGVPGRPGYSWGHSKGPEHAPEECGGPGAPETERRARKGQASLTTGRSSQRSRPFSVGRRQPGNGRARQESRPGRSLTPRSCAGLIKIPVAQSVPSL
jgi:hypothetical protein